VKQLALEAAQSAEPALTYEKFWRKLKSELGTPIKGQLRLEWQALRPQEPLTIDTWRAFMIKYREKRSKLGKNS